MRDTPIEPAAASYSSELQIWLSPNFPVGSFAYSQGLETAIDQGWVHDQISLHDWIVALIRYGTLRNDLILISLIMRAESHSSIDQLIDLSVALQPSAERAKEATDQGANFVAAYRSGWSTPSASEDAFDQHSVITLPAALAVAARAHQLSRTATLEAYAVAFCTNLLSAAIRLSVIGQFDGQRLMARVLPMVREATQFACSATLDELGSATYGADLASMLHETQPTRLFRS